MSSYDPKEMEKNLKKAFALQEHRTLSVANLFPRDEDDPSVHNPDPIKLPNGQLAYISHGQGIRATQEDKADVLIVDVKEDPLIFLENMILKLHEGIKELPHQKRIYSPGSTLNLSLQINGNIYTVNLGDSRAILLERKNKNKFIAKALSWDHKPTDVDEVQRIKREGGSVSYGRLNGALALSRALGDCEHDGYGISHDPDMTFIEVDPETEAYIINCCDGVVDVMREKDIAEFFDHIDLLKNPADQLRKEAYLKGSMDNISVCFTPVVKNSDTGILSYVADGHGGDEVSNYIYERLRKTLMA